MGVTSSRPPRPAQRRPPPTVVAQRATMRFVTATRADVAVSYWLRDPAPAGIADPPLAAGRAARGRRRHRRRRVHRPVDRDRADRYRPGAARRGPRGGDRRIRRQRPERRVLRGEPDARPGQRHPPLPRRAGDARARGHRQPAGLIAFTREHGIDCDLEETGTLSLADQAVPGRRVPRRGSTRPPSTGSTSSSSIGDAARAEVHSPLWQAGLYRPPGRDVLLDPAKLCRGIARVAHERGVRIHEGTPVSGLERRAGGVAARDRRPARRVERRDTSSSPPRPTRAGWAGLGRRSCRSTTTRSCPSR